MYNFNFLANEELIEIFEDTWVGQGDNEKTTTIALTNQRILFLDYGEDSYANLRIAEGIDYPRYKDVYYSIKLNDIKNIDKNETYIINLKDGSNFEIDNDKLIELINQEIKGK